ncbi:type II secretion system protein [Methylotuvimicrobium buryatense]|uniref:Type II secretion system protein n=1 Tax=Methylotuvimicrobium buryatense TaxID=95641 RepID=A0A4P9UU50_METBY|nr:type II secretion system protein [Methylotuvimicrobium buryatense]QCW84170.1 type II secretion system protein [Methylotuvimicrobium buryatense]
MPLIATDRIDRMPAPKRRQRGLTLVELTVTLLILTVLATIAIRSTNDLGFQVRYEQTKERLEMIRNAILGNPRLIINGQQAISGFVADMGRLPGSVRDLLQASACIVGGVATQKSLLECESDGGSWTWFDTPCTDDVSTTQIDCSIAGGLWLGWQIHLESGLGYGWRGPYLNVSGNPDGTDTFTDGWGRTGVDKPGTLSIDEAISNYGWELENTPSINDLKIISYGKDQVYDGGSCSNDFNCDFFTQILVSDYQKDIFPGITVKLQGRVFSMDSHCSNASYTTRVDCEAAQGIWYGGCSEGIPGSPSPSYSNKTTCEAASKTWKSCSLAVYTTQTDCEDNDGIWYGEGYGCSDAAYSNKTACKDADASNTWNSCSDKDEETRAGCEATTPASNWFGDGVAGESRLVCLRVYHYSNGSIDTLIPTSTPVIYEDGAIHNLVFDFPVNSLIKTGEARIAIYYQRGVDGCKTTIPYPWESKPQPITIYPRTSLPVINW